MAFSHKIKGKAAKVNTNQNNERIENEHSFSSYFLQSLPVWRVR